MNTGKVVIMLSLLTIAAKIAGFGEKMVIAHYFGTKAGADIYFAMTGVVLSVVYLVKELVHPSFLPVFVQAIKENTMKSARLYRQFILISITVLMLVGLGMILFSDQIVLVSVPGFSHENKELSSILLKWLSPAGVFLGLAAIASTTLNARKIFIKASISEMLYKVLLLLGILMLIPYFHIYAIPLVMLICSFVLCITLLHFIPENKYLLSNAIGHSPDLSKVFVLMMPIAVGVIVSHVNGLVDNILASTLPTGQLSYLNYSKKLIDALLLIGPVALVTVTYSHLAGYSQQSHEQYVNLFIQVLRLIVYVSFPIAILIITLKEPIVQILFERGLFDVKSTFRTSKALMVYGMGFITLSLESHLVCSFYAKSDTRTPVYIGIFCVIIDILLAVALLRRYFFLGIAIAFVLSKTIKVGMLLLILEKKYQFIRKSQLFLFSIKIIISCIPSVLVLYWLYLYRTSGTIYIMAVQKIALPALGFLFMYYTLTMLFKVEEAVLLRQIVFTKIGITSKVTK